MLGYVKSSDKISTTGWQAHDGQGSACGCHAACPATARAHKGRVSPRSAQEVAVAANFTTRVPLNVQTSAIEQRWPKHNSQRNALDDENGLL